MLLVLRWSVSPRMQQGREQQESELDDEIKRLKSIRVLWNLSIDGAVGL